MTQGSKKTSLFRPWAASASASASSGEAPIISRLEGMVGAIDDRELTTVEPDPSSLTDTLLAAAHAQAHAQAALMYGFADTSLLLLEQEHLQMQAQSSQAAQRKQRPKKYRCPHCQVAFSNNGQLRGHVRIHTGEFISAATKYSCTRECANLIDV